MKVNRLQSNNYTNQQNFKGYVGPSMKRYVSSQMEREVAHLNDMQFGLFTNTPTLVNRVKTLHAQVQDKLNSFMELLDPNISMEYQSGLVKLQNNDSRKTLMFVPKDIRKAVTGKIYGDTIDMFCPPHVHCSGEITLLYIDTFADALTEKVGNKAEKINKKLKK